MKDPLAGRREAINDGRAGALTWPDTGDGCPVEAGEVFHLRSCSIEITRLQRTRRDGVRIHMALFARYTPDKIHLLPRSGGDYVEDAGRAMPAQDDPDAATIASVDPLSNPLNLHGPPEPEAVPPDEIPNYIGSLEAHQLLVREQAERRVAEQAAPIEQRLARLREASAHQHVDISSELRIVERQVAKAERKVLERAA